MLWITYRGLTKEGKLTPWAKTSLIISIVGSVLVGILHLSEIDMMTEDFFDDGYEFYILAAVVAFIGFLSLLLSCVIQYSGVVRVAGWVTIIGGAIGVIWGLIVGDELKGDLFLSAVEVMAFCIIFFGEKIGVKSEWVNH